MRRSALVAGLLGHVRRARGVLLKAWRRIRKSLAYLFSKPVATCVLEILKFVKTLLEILKLIRSLLSCSFPVQGRFSIMCANDMERMIYASPRVTEVPRS